MENLSMLATGQREILRTSVPRLPLGSWLPFPSLPHHSDSDDATEGRQFPSCRRGSLRAPWAPKGSPALCNHSFDYLLRLLLTGWGHGRYFRFGNPSTSTLRSLVASSASGCIQSVLLMPSFSCLEKSTCGKFLPSAASLYPTPFFLSLMQFTRHASSYFL